MIGLKELWGLGDPAALDPRVFQQFEQEIQRFASALDGLNQSLRYTAANAQQTSHDALDRRRIELISRYQQALASSGDTSRTLPNVLAQTDLLCVDAAQLAETTRILKSRWEQQASTFESTEESVAQSSEPTSELARAQQGLTKVVEAAKLRDYQTALDQLNVIAGPSQRSTASLSVDGTQLDTKVNERRFALSDKLPRDPVVPLDPRLLEGWENPLVNGDPRDLFTPERMDAVIDMHFAGEGSRELNEAMKGVLFAKPGDDVTRHLAEIGRQRGLDPNVVQSQYDRFRQLQNVATQSESVRGLPADEVTTSRREEYLQAHGEFLGNQSNLRFGQVVGEATGLDPAFAAMLNPTGGMVGPGMDVLAPTNADSPVIRHGIFHDAGGYLLNYQNSGPGYTYLQDKQPTSGRRGADPIQGQVEGVSYWYERSQTDSSIFDHLYEFDITAADSREKQLFYDRYVKHPIEDSEACARDLSEDAVKEIRELTGDVRRFSRDSVDSLKSSTRDAADAVQEQVGEANQTLDEMADQARQLGVTEELVGTSQQAIKATLAGVHSQVVVWEQQASATFDAAGKYVDDNVDAVDRWADEAGATVRQTASEIGDDIDQSIHGELVELTRDKDFQDALQRSANFVGETKQDVQALVDTTNRQIESAKAQVNDFYHSSMATTKKGAGRAVQEFTRVKDDLIAKLSTIQDTATKAVDGINREVDDLASELAKTGQDIKDAAAGVADSLSDSVNGGTDTLAHMMGSATDFAADSLDRLTNLLG